MDGEISELTHLAGKARSLRLFLDYDGTLAEFAETPGIIAPDTNLISLMKRLVDSKGILPAVISGRSLTALEALLPVKGLMLGGCYGIEMRLPDGSTRSAVPFAQVRPSIEKLLPHWKTLIEGLNGFFLEDKGWSLALHARFSLKSEADTVLNIARAAAESIEINPQFTLLSGDRFLEFLPLEANKARSVRWILEETTPKEALVLYFGDDEKDEEAFAEVLARGGHAVHVGMQQTKTSALYTLTGPLLVRAWLDQLLDLRSDGSSSDVLNLNAD